MMAFAQNAVFYVLPFLLVMSLIVTVHEFGHFLMARAFGVAVDRFSIGFGRALLSWRDRAGVEWRLGWLPLGGYVRFAGDENAASVPDKTDLEQMRAQIAAREGPGAEQRYLAFKPLWQRALVVVAGPLANFILAIVLFAIGFAIFGQPVTTTRVEVTPGGAAAQAGFHNGDVLRMADGRPLGSFEDVALYVQVRAGVPIDFTVERNGRPLHLVATPATQAIDSPFGGKDKIGKLGLAARGGALRHYGPIEALSLGVTRSWDVGSTTVFYLGRIVTGQVGADQLHSLIGIGRATGSMTRQVIADAAQVRVNWVVATAFLLIQLAALLSVNIGLFNLLPVPVLDGGHLLFYAYEWVARRPLRAEVQAAGYRLGLALIVGLMLFATWNDLQRLRVVPFLGSLFS